MVAGGIVGDEVDRGEGVAIGGHAAVVDAFALPELAQHRAVGVVADRREVADARALARRRDREVRAVAAEALQVEAAAFGAGLVELDHRLAEGEDVDGGHVVALQRYLSSVSRMNITVAKNWKSAFSLRAKPWPSFSARRYQTRLPLARALATICSDSV